MIKKLQIKFVTMTMSIFLAVFIAVLVSINLIMQAMMKSQSRVVLNQIATSIRYDENTSTFSFKVPDSGKEVVDQPADERPDLPPPTNPEQLEKPSTAPTQPDTSAPPVQTAPPPTKPNNEFVYPSAPPPPTTTKATETTMAETITTTTTTTIANTTGTTTTATTTPPTEPNTPPTTDNNYWQPPAYWEGNGGNNWWEQPPNNNNNNNFNGFVPPWNWGFGYYYPFTYPQINNDNQDNEHKNNNENSDFTPPKSESDEKHEPQSSDNHNGNPTPQADYNTDENKKVLLSDTGLTGIIDDFTIVTPPSAEVVITEKNNEIHAAPHRDAATIDYFVLMADSAGNLVDSLYCSDVDNTLAQKYINSILKKDSKTGMIDTLQYYKMNKSNGTVLVFTDKTAELDMLKKLTKITIIIGSISFILIAALVIYLSKVSIAPVKKAFEKQKQFVSDASHELKTPLTIISTNADVLCDEIGENKWLTYIKSQTDRMSLLVNDLLNLTRIENNSADIVSSEFNLSKAILNTALPFECQAFESNKKFVVEVQDGISLNASEQHIKQMAAIFIDNAIKHSGNNDEVKISLYKQGDKRIFSVFNTGSSIPENERDKIFERFYRSDASRARSTGGYGLGLAIAKSIIDFHKFKVNVSGVEGENVCFTVIM